jgi:hypothetical protein
MSTLLIPAAGASSRFNNLRPKWLLTMPDGTLMVEAAISGLDMDCFDRVILTVLEDHVARYSNYDVLAKILKKSIRSDLEIFQLESPTSSQVETIAMTIEKCHVDSSFLIKDCDNKFCYRYGGGNEVATISLHDVGRINAANKSYVQTDPLGVITNIVEKRVVSDTFCCGAYGFSSVDDFMYARSKCTGASELYVSHLIFQLILDGVSFKAVSCSGYDDWGTLGDFRSFANDNIVIFCDIDGVMVENSSRFAVEPWALKPLVENVEAIKALMARRKVHLIVTTSRPAERRGELECFLFDLGIRADGYVMDLPHSKRVIINDFSDTNPYPSAVAINLERNSRNLSGLFEHISSL